MSDDEFGGFGDDFADDAQTSDFGGGFEEINSSGFDDFGGFGEEDFEDYAGDQDGGGDTAIPEGDEDAEDDDFEDEPDTYSNGHTTAQSAQQVDRPKPYVIKESSSTVTVTTSARSIAVNMNKDNTKASQPFTAGYDMTLNTKTPIKGLALRRMFFNCCMVHPGSFGVEIRTAADGGGDVVAREEGIRAPANFSQTVVEFNQQPMLTEGQVYHLHVVLEQGAFKFQGALVKDKRELHKFNIFKSNEAKWMQTNMTFVTKPVYQKPIPKLGEKSGFLLVKIVQKQQRGLANRRMSLRRNTNKVGMRRFVVLEKTEIHLYNQPDGPVDRVLRLRDMEYCESKGGAMDTKDFNVAFKDAELHMAATSAADCHKWIRAIDKAQKLVPREYGAAASTNMMF